MQAMLPDLTQNKKEYKPLDDDKARNLILIIFNLIKNEKDFSDNAMENYRVAIQSEKGAIITNNKNNSWLKFVLAAIFAIATIVLIILDHFLIALIPFVCMFAPFIIPKLCKSRCGCLPIFSSGVKDDNHDLDSHSYEYENEMPDSTKDNYKQIKQ